MEKLTANLMRPGGASTEHPRRIFTGHSSRNDHVDNGSSAAGMRPGDEATSLQSSQHMLEVPIPGQNHRRRAAASRLWPSGQRLTDCLWCLSHPWL